MSDERDFRAEMADGIQRLLLRFFRTGDHVSFATRTVRLREDLEYLRIQWAISSQVDDLLHYLLENRHEAQASLTSRIQDDAGQIRGRLIPVRTILRRRLTGDVSKVSYREPVRSFTDGPNYVLGWVLRFSHHILQRYVVMLSGSPEYGQRFHKILSSLAAVRHLAGIGNAVGNINIRQRPSVKSVTQAGTSRRRLYRKAYVAYQTLEKVESGDDIVTLSLLNGSLIGPLEDWQKYELLLGLRLAEALSSSTGNGLVLYPIEAGVRRPIASVGQFDVYWQNRTALQGFPDLEPSEARVNDILSSYGFAAGWDRPDIVICDRVHRTVLAIAEAKYSVSRTSEWHSAFRESVSQIVRYSRLYEHHSPQDELIPRSIVAVSNLPKEMSHRPIPNQAPIAIGMSELLNGDLQAWTRRIMLALNDASVA